MGTTLTQVLAAIENNKGPLSLNRLADQFDVSRGMLEDMLQFWVRKGRLRVIEAGAEVDCSCCAARAGCPLVAKMPRRYEIVDSNSNAGTENCCEYQQPE
ncbi:MAG: hypothetical protein JXJ17_01270 [Anaerolineae bacterium]|nr:hypothetical protein [Anaerolineae bacterium]